MPFVMQDRRLVQTVLKPVVVPQVHFLAGCSHARYGVREWWTCPSLVNDRSLFVDVGDSGYMYGVSWGLHGSFSF